MAVNAYGGVAKHAELAGLGNDDHPQYALPLQGTAAARPAPTRAGARYLATDTGVESISDGTAWHNLAGGTHAHDYLPVGGKAADAKLLDGYGLARLDYQRRAQMLAHHSAGQGRVRWDGGTFGWSDRIIMLGAGRGTHGATAGWIGLWQPASGTVVQGSGGAGDVTTTAGGIPIPVHTALYADVTDTASTGTIVYKIVGYTAEFVVPPHWLLVAHRSESDGRLWTCTDGLVDYWRRFSFQNGWVEYGSSVASHLAGYRRMPDGMVQMRGLIVPGTLGAVFANLPGGWRPATHQYWTSWCYSGSAHVVGTAHMNMNGNLNINSGPAAGGWASLDNMHFVAEA